MKGGPQYAMQARAAARQTGALGSAVLKTSANMQVASKRTWAYSQFLFTARRYAFYATLAVSALAVGVAKLGFSYLNAMQTARVALQPAFNSSQALTKELNTLYILAAQSPFLFKDTLQAFRTAYPAFHAAGLSVQLTNQTLKASIDALSEAGKTSPMALNRISVQLQHMANIGRPTGQVLLALARDGLPVYPALRKELGLTGRSLADMARSGLTAQQVIRAINRYIETSPLYKGAAFRQANLTLSGSWQQFKDILSQAAGRGEAGLFGGLHSALKRVNDDLVPLMRGGKPITLYNVATAIDRSLTPRTHVIINLFVFFTSVVRTMIIVLGGLMLIITTLLRPLDYLGSLFGANRLGARLLGIAFGVLISLFIIYKTAVVLSTLAMGAWEVAVIGMIGGAKIAIFFLRILSFVMGIDFEAAVLRAMYAMDAMKASMAFLTSEVYGLTVALLLNPITWIVLAVLALTVGLVVLYFKWKRFHNEVNSFWKDLIYYSPLVALALTSAFGPIGAAVTALLLLIRYWKQFKSETGLTFSRQQPRGHGVFSTRPGGGKKNVANTFFGINLGDLLHPHFARGGTMGYSGRALVGEYGPELVTLPRGSVVEPFGQTTLDGAGSLSIHVYPQAINIDGKHVGTALATVTTDKKARMSGRG